MLKTIDPRQFCIALQPRRLARKVSESIGVKVESSCQGGRSARSGPPSRHPAASCVEDLADVGLARLTHVAGFDFLPRGPGLSLLPFLCRAQLGAILEFGEMLVQKDTRSRGDLELPLLGMEREPPALGGRKLDAERPDPLGGSGFHYHTLVRGTYLREVIMCLSEHGHRFAVTM